MRGKDEKLPPHSPEAERAVLGSCLIDPDAVPVIATILGGPEDFYKDEHRWAWEAILALHRDGAPVDVLTVGDRMEADGTLQAAGGTWFLTGLAAETPTSVHAKHYARIVERAATRRRLIAAGGAIVADAFDESKELAEVENEAARVVLEARSRQNRHAVKASVLVKAYYDRLEIMMRDGRTPGLPTGFVDLDKILGGMQRSDLIVLGARPAMGKTSLALCIARNATTRFGAKVGLFSMEMSSDQIMQRLVAIESAIAVNSLKQGQITEAEFPAFMRASDVVDRMTLWVDDEPGLSPETLRAKCLEVEAKAGGLDLVIVDYLQLMRGKGHGRYEIVTEISQALKALARDLHVPVLALSQLSRSCEGRLNKRPILSDLRESGDIEQTANQVAFLYRDEVVNPETTESPNIAEIIVAKNRDGAIGTCRLFFQKTLTRFVDAEVRTVDDGEWF